MITSKGNGYVYKFGDLQEYYQSPIKALLMKKINLQNWVLT